MKVGEYDGFLMDGANKKKAKKTISLKTISYYGF